MNQIEGNAFELLVSMVESGGGQFENSSLQQMSALTADDLNDAVDYLESIGAVSVLKFIGTAPFNFGIVSVRN